MAYVYKITNIVNNKFYIGSSIDYERRWKEHTNDLNNNRHVNKHLQCSWNKYGEDNFNFKIIEKCDDELQFDREQYYLDTLNPFGKSGYNISRLAIGQNNYTNKEYNIIMSIKKDLKRCISISEISKRYNKSEGCIKSIKYLLTWKYVAPKLNIFLKNDETLKNINNNSIIRFGLTFNELRNKINKNKIENNFIKFTYKTLYDYNYRMNLILSRKNDEFESYEYEYLLEKGVL